MRKISKRTCRIGGELKAGAGTKAGLAAFRLVGETRAAGWIEQAMSERWTKSALRLAVLSPLASAPTAKPSRGRIVCTCHDVAEGEIAGAFGKGLTLAEVQRELRCGTGCGSCVPELKHLERAGRSVAA